MYLMIFIIIVSYFVRLSTEYNQKPYFCYEQVSENYFDSTKTISLSLTVYFDKILSQQQSAIQHFSYFSPVKYFSTATTDKVLMVVGQCKCTTDPGNIAQVLTLRKSDREDWPFNKGQKSNISPDTELLPLHLGSNGQ